MEVGLNDPEEARKDTNENKREGKESAYIQMIRIEGLISHTRHIKTVIKGERG